MSLQDSKAAISKATKDLFNTWSQAREHWTDARAAEFEATFLVQIEQDVHSALVALDSMNQLLQRIQTDCE